MFAAATRPTPRSIVRRYDRDVIVDLVRLLTDGAANLDVVRRNIDRIEDEPTSAAEAAARGLGQQQERA